MCSNFFLGVVRKSYLNTFQVHFLQRLVVLASPLWASLYPMMTAAYNEKTKSNHYLFRKYMNMYLMIGIPALFGLTIIPPALLKIQTN